MLYSKSIFKTVSVINISPMTGYGCRVAAQLTTWPSHSIYLSYLQISGLKVGEVFIHALCVSGITTNVIQLEGSPCPRHTAIDSIKASLHCRQWIESRKPSAQQYCHCHSGYTASSSVPWTDLSWSQSKFTVVTVTQLNFLLVIALETLHMPT